MYMTQFTRRGVLLLLLAFLMGVNFGAWGTMLQFGYEMSISPYSKLWEQALENENREIFKAYEKYFK